MGWFLLVYLGLECLGVFVVLVLVFFCLGFVFEFCFALFLFCCWIVFGVVAVLFFFSCFFFCVLSVFFF